MQTDALDARLAALGVPNLRRVVGALPEANVAFVLGRVIALNDDLAAVNKRIADWQEAALVIQRKLDEEKVKAAASISHEWSGGEIADALQECDL